MATFTNFFRANTDDLSVLHKFDSSISADTAYMPLKKIIVTNGTAALSSGAPPIATQLVLGASLDTAITTARGRAYIFLQAGKVTGATSLQIKVINNNSTAASKDLNISTHTLTAAGDTVIIPWNVNTALGTVDKFPTIFGGLTSTSATKSVELFISVFTLES